MKYEEHVPRALPGRRRYSASVGGGGNCIYRAIELLPGKVPFMGVEYSFIKRTQMSNFFTGPGI